MDGMYRFFVNERHQDYFKLSPTLLKHLKVLRLQAHEKFICIYQRRFYLCQRVGEQAQILEALDDQHEYKHTLVLFAAIIKPKNFEWLIQKATELGVKSFYPLVTAHTNPKYVAACQTKWERLQQIVQNAAEQAFRNDLMQIHAPLSFSEAITMICGQGYLAHEQALGGISKWNFRGDLSFYVGPEGGFSATEVAAAQAQGIAIVSLGKRILRAETAALALLANVAIDN